MTQEVVDLAPGALPIAQALGFTARSVIVDNYTSSYVTLGDVGKTVPPWTYGAVVALPPGIRRATAVLTPTVPAVPGPPVPVSKATLTWTDDALPAAPGHLLQQSGISNVLLTDRIDTAGGTNSKQYPMPAGAQTVMVTMDRDKGNRSVNPTQLNVFCVPSDFACINIGGSALNLNPSPLGLINAEDNILEIDWTMAGGNALNVFLAVAVFGANLIRPQNVAFQFDANQNLLTSMASASPATWEAPNLAPIPVSFALGAGLSTTLLAAAVGQTVRIFSCAITYDAVPGSGALQLQDTAGTNLHFFEGTTLVPSPLYAYGAPLAVGKGVQMNNPFGVTVTARGSLVASQA